MNSRMVKVRKSIVHYIDKFNKIISIDAEKTLVKSNAFFLDIGQMS